MKVDRYGLKKEAVHSSEMLVPFTRLHGVTFQKIVLLLLTAFKASDFTVMGWISGQIFGRADPVSHPTDVDDQLSMN